MNSKDLSKEEFLLRSKTPRIIRKLTARSTRAINTCKHDELSEFPLASASDVGIFALLDLPLELVEAIISHLIGMLGVCRAVRLRVVNSKSNVAGCIYYVSGSTDKFPRIIR
jgi:hypothetical protein